MGPLPGNDELDVILSRLQASENGANEVLRMKLSRITRSPCGESFVLSDDLAWGS